MMVTFVNLANFLAFKDTLAIPKSVKKSPGLTKMRLQNSKIMFSVVHDVILSVSKNLLTSISQKIMTIMFSCQ